MGVAAPPERPAAASASARLSFSAPADTDGDVCGGGAATVGAVRWRSAEVGAAGGRRGSSGGAADGAIGLGGTSGDCGRCEAVGVPSDAAALAD